MTPARSEALFRIGWIFAVALSVAAYLGVWSGHLVWDDVDLVWNTRLPGGGSAVGGGDSLLHCFTRPFLWNYYRPLVSASFYVEHHLFGLNPLGYHISNTLMHALATAAMAPFLMEAFGRRSSAIAGALLFAVHPVHVSAVGWIGGRTDAMCCLWTVLFSWLLVRAARSSGGLRLRCIAASLGFYVLALMTKEQMLAGLPLVPLAFACFPRHGGENRRGAGWAAAIPFAVAAALFFVIGGHLGMPRIPPPRADRVTQMAMAGWTWVHYTRLLLLPTGTLLDTFSLSGYERVGWGGALLGWGISIGVVCLFARWMRTHRASAWFLALTAVLMAPVSNLVPMWFLLLGPYRAALSSIGVCALLGQLADVDVRDAWVRYAARAMAVGLCLWFLATTLASLGTWRSDMDLFSSIARDDPDGVLGHYMAGRMLLATRKEADAARHFERILDVLYRSDAWRRPDDAVRVALGDRAVRLRVMQHQGGAKDPRIFLSLVFALLGSARSEVGDTAAARRAYGIAERLNPGTADVSVALGVLAYRDGNFPEAERCFVAALHAHPPRPDARGRLAQVYEAEGRLEEASALRGSSE